MTGVLFYGMFFLYNTTPMFIFSTFRTFNSAHKTQMKKLIILITLSSIIFSCTEARKEVSKEDAIRYNNFLVHSIDQVVIKMLDFEEAIYEEDKDKIKLLHAELKSLISKTRQKVGQKPAFDGNESFKNSLIDILNYYKHVIDNDYDSIIKLVDNKKEFKENSDKIETIISKVYDNENEYYSKFEEEVISFADKYKLDIKELDDFY